MQKLLEILDRKLDCGFIQHKEHIDIWFEHKNIEVITKTFIDHKKDLSERDKIYFYWLIARVHAVNFRWGAVAKTLYEMREDVSVRLVGNFNKMIQVLLVDSLIKAKQISKARVELERLKQHYQGAPEIYLLNCNLIQHDDSINDPISSTWLSSLNKIYEKNNLENISLDGDVLLNNLVSKSDKEVDGPLVSIIVPVKNGGDSIDVAIKSLLNQTYKNIEIIVVNDGSEDNTIEVVDSLARTDDRIKLHSLGESLGAYGARNYGLDHARGQFVTVHDADDWSHCQKIEMQARRLIDNKLLKGCFSSWVRSGDDLTFGRWESLVAWRGWTAKNVSSLMLRREVFSYTGYWLELKAGSDYEFYKRMQRFWSYNFIEVVMPDVPLAFGRSDDYSLTMNKDTHILTSFYGYRADQREKYTAWHNSVGDKVEELYVPRGLKAIPI